MTRHLQSREYNNSLCAICSEQTCQASERTAEGFDHGCLTSVALSRRDSHAWPELNDQIGKTPGPMDRISTENISFQNVSLEGHPGCAAVE
jgi:hypothetical protein